jgi:nickel/cobalt transporter (NicO) family protein
MLSAIALGHTVLGLSLLAFFSAGLALVLMAVGALVLFAKNKLPQTKGLRGPFFRLVPVFSAVVVMILGVLMTLSAAGILKPVRFLL